MVSNACLKLSVFIGTKSILDSFGLVSKMLIYADVNMNVIDGSSIWLASITEAIAEHAGQIHLLLKSNISRETVLHPLLSKENINDIIDTLFF